jgi:hypothetical protein
VVNFGFGLIQSTHAVHRRKKNNHESGANVEVLTILSPKNNWGKYIHIGDFDSKKATIYAKNRENRENRYFLLKSVKNSRYEWAILTLTPAKYKLAVKYVTLSF